MLFRTYLVYSVGWADLGQTQIHPHGSQTRLLQDSQGRWALRSLSLVSYSPQGHKASDTTKQLSTAQNCNKNLLFIKKKKKAVSTLFNGSQGWGSREGGFKRRAAVWETLYSVYILLIIIMCQALYHLLSWTFPTTTFYNSHFIYFQKASQSCSLIACLKFHHLRFILKSLNSFSISMCTHSSILV